MYEKLFEPINIGTLQIKNRFVIPAISTLDATTDGACTEQYAAYLERRAQGGWGLIITEYYGIAPNVGFFSRMNGIWNEELIKGHKEMTDRVHKAGAKIGAQINHAGRESFTEVTAENVVAPLLILMFLPNMQYLKLYLENYQFLKSKILLVNMVTRL